MLLLVIGVATTQIHCVTAQDFKNRMAKGAKIAYERAIEDLQMEYDEKLEGVRKHCLEELKAARTDALAKGQLEEAQRILGYEEEIATQSKKVAIAEPRIVSLWKLVSADKREFMVALANDGSFYEMWGKGGTWTFRDGVLEIAYRRKNQADQPWINVYEMSPDGLSLKGTNSDGQSISGQYLFGSLESIR